MPKKIFLAITVMILLATAVLAGIFDSMKVKREIFTIRSVEKETGATRWESQIEAQLLDHEGKSYIYFSEKGKDLREDGGSWISNAYSWIENDRIIPYSVNLLVKDHEGNIEQKISKFYASDEHKVICMADDKLKEFEFGSNTVDKQTLAISLMDFPFEKNQEMVYHLISNEPAEYQIWIEPRGVEKLQINGQTIECYKLEMIFNIGALNILNYFIPKFYFWYETKPPHNFIRYEGLESGLGTPYVRVDAVY